jgi:perosamine synthetase
VPEIRGNEWAYLKECLDTGWVSSAGPFVDRFEREIGSYVGAAAAVATASGTAALHVALLVAGVQPDDEVLVPTLTFVAPANAVRYVGARPVFIDAEPDHWQLDPRKVARFLDRECRWSEGALRNRATGRRVSAILPVHILGHPVDMDPILELAHRHELVVVEDATEALGAQYKGRPVGRLGDIGCFSFNGNKLITCGGGGMIVTDRVAWAEQARYLTTQAKDDPEEFVHGAVGFNYRLTNLQAAMGCAQLETIGARLEQKRRIAEDYAELLGGVPGIQAMVEADWARSAWWMYTVLIDEVEFGRDSRTLLRALANERIQSRPLWQPMHRSPAHRGSQAYQCEIADRLYRDALSLPCSVGIRRAEQEWVASVVRRCVSRGGVTGDGSFSDAGPVGGAGSHAVRV